MHAFREANFIVDALAKHRQGLSWGLHVFHQLPPFLSTSFFANCSKTFHVKNCS